MKKVVGFLVGVMLLTPVVGHAQTIDREAILAQIEALTLIVLQLQAQLLAQQSMIQEHVEVVAADEELVDEEQAMQERGYWEALDVDYDEVDNLISQLKETVKIVMPTTSTTIMGVTCDLQKREMDSLIDEIRSVTHKYNFPTFTCSRQGLGYLDRADFRDYVLGL